MTDPNTKSRGFAFTALPLPRSIGVGLFAALASFVFAGSAAWAQGVPNTPPAEQPAQPSDDKPAEKPSGSSLDDLLGIDEDKPDADVQDAAKQDHDQELKRKLNEVDLADAFQQAVAKMSISAELLDTKFDPGLGTQRVQEDIIAKLTQLIDQARRQKSNSSSSSSSSSQQQQQQQNQPKNANQQQKQESKTQNSQNNDQRTKNASNSREGDPPSMQEGDINNLMEETRTEWGGLPQRVREMLIQGRKERFSSLYEQLTNEYYRKLAEEHAP